MVFRMPEKGDKNERELVEVNLGSIYFSFPEPPQFIITN